MSQSVNMDNVWRSRTSDSACRQQPSAGHKLPCRRHRSRTGLAWLATLLLAAQLAGTECFTHWVAVGPDYSTASPAELDNVRVDTKVILPHVSVSGSTVTLYERQTVDLSTRAGSLPFTPSEANEIASGRLVRFDKLLLGDESLSNAVVSWPTLTGYRKTPRTFDLHTHLVERKALNPWPTVAIVGGAVLLVGGLVGLVYAVGSTSHRGFLIY